MRRFPDYIRGMKGMTGTALAQLMDICEKNLDKLDEVEKYNRALRHTQELKTIRLAEWVPVNSDKGLRRLFRVIFISYL